MAAANAAALESLPVAARDSTTWARKTVADHMARVGGPDSTEPWFLAL